MRKWTLPELLFDSEQERGGGGSDTIRVDPGAPMELPDPAEKEPARPAKSADAIKAEQLEADNVKLKKRADEADEDARYWSNRARARRDAAEADDAPASRRREAEPATPAVAAEKPEDLIDDLNKRGLDALKARGFLTQEEVDAKIAEANEQTDAKITEARSDAEFGGKFASEFPEMAADSARVSKGEKPQSELFKRAGVLYRAAVDEDPSLKGSKGLLLMVARQAKKDLADEARPTRRTAAEVDEPARPSRRERIAAQRPDHAPGDEETGGGDNFTEVQRAVMKNLKVTPESFKKHSEVARNGRR